MPICYGPVISKKIPSTVSVSSDKAIIYCYFCNDEVFNCMKCLNPDCFLTAHIICLSKCFLKRGEYVPVEGQCPHCGKNYLWGDLVRKYKGCYNNEDVMIKTDVGDEFYGSDSE